MATTRHRMAEKIPREASARGFETIEKEFERLYRVVNALANVVDEDAAAVTPASGGTGDGYPPQLGHARI